ncbi:single-stranded DNA-binding protein [Deinococcus radiopugnans]|uniref:Single-stranded DNA-binding protein n=1 Tax=Deinococcus radiopugnans TaxID=57497 RepID=A0A0A7KKF2_9DEIO|nr:Rad52/Rad22 family DNA repair protein [Deinococcus radiopugnans]AIZ46560.1 single-stranded DNA-binding protein [Deinococcus radiopugnans]
MTYAEVKARLAAPFPEQRVRWRAQQVSKDRRTAMMVAYIDSRTVMERLDDVCPDGWAFDVELLPGATLVMKGRLTVLGQTRCDVGLAGEGGEAATHKAATSDALKRCAVHFGIGRYLYDLPAHWAAWDDRLRAPVQPPTLPQWALPGSERTAGAQHVLQMLDSLRTELPSDTDQLREVYRHLKLALSVVGPPEDQDRALVAQ